MNSNLKNKQVHYVLIGPETKKSRRWIKCQSSHMSNTEKQAQQKVQTIKKCVSNFDPVFDNQNINFYGFILLFI